MLQSSSLRRGNVCYKWDVVDIKSKQFTVLFKIIGKNEFVPTLNRFQQNQFCLLEFKND